MIEVEEKMFVRSPPVRKQNMVHSVLGKRTTPERHSSQRPNLMITVTGIQVAD